MDDIISSIQTSSQTLEQKINTLNTFKLDSENFTSDVIRIDGDVADLVKKRKDDFYSIYSYLKPEYKKSAWEKTKEWFAGAGEWCKEHWISIVAAVVVVLIAVVAAVCGVAIAFIAAVAGIIALVLTIADVICMLATGGKGIADVLRENGLYVLADIFQGVSFGADLVSIVFPLGAALKTMARVGVKAFAKGTIKAARLAFKETIEKVFKSGFKNGLKNLGDILFKSLIFDIDDFSKVKNGKRVWDIWEPSVDMKGPTQNWSVKDDQLIPSSDIIPGKYNSDNLTMEGIMKQDKFNDFPDSVPYKNGEPDLSGFSVANVDISMTNPNPKDIDAFLNGEISPKQLKERLRNMNFKNANTQLKLNFDNSLVDYATKGDFEKALGYQLTWHEDLNMKKCWLVPTEIHGNIGHTGGIGNYNFNFLNIPNICDQISERLAGFGLRSASGWGVEVATNK